MTKRPPETTDINPLILYGYWRSSCTWRVRLVLEYKNIIYNYKPINLLKDEQHSVEYLNINPCGLVPSIIIPLDRDKRVCVDNNNNNNNNNNDNNNDTNNNKDNN
eukprot:Tbor_TRINITY_DN5480_c4_g1::TRINITY_DN5480_c4_g1_i4::g.25184::m.25184/K01800/maiA, GSTZ1; maleylacetoacetate isomerase